MCGRIRVEQMDQETKTPDEIEQERKERNVKLTRIAKGFGVVIRVFGTFFYKLGNGIARSCDKSLAKPENRAILKKMGKLPKKNESEHDKFCTECGRTLRNCKCKTKEIIIKIPRD